MCRTGNRFALVKPIAIANIDFVDWTLRVGLATLIGVNLFAD